MAKLKTLVLTQPQENELMKNGVVQIKKGDLFITLELVGNEIVMSDTQDLSNKIDVVCPLDLPVGSLVLTHLENKELNETGKTTHTKANIEYIIYKNDGEIKVFAKNPYGSVLTFSDTH